MYSISKKKLKIKKLRKKTSLGFMDCKNALSKAKGNIEKAIEILKKKGKKIAISRIKNNNQGSVITKINKKNNIGIILKINCETDFVANNNFFKKIIFDISKKAIKCNSIKKLLKYKINNITIKEYIIEKMNIIGEKIEITQFEKINAPFISSYTHHNNKIASLVGFSFYIKGIEKIAKNIAMQITAMNPIAIKKLDSSLIEKEKKIIKMQLLKNNNIPKHIINNIIEGKIQKLFSEKILIYQNFIKNNDLTVDKYLKNFNSELKILSFKRVEI